MHDNGANIMIILQIVAELYCRYIRITLNISDYQPINNEKFLYRTNLC